jgi:hypothetical protein
MPGSPPPGMSASDSKVNLAASRAIVVRVSRAIASSTVPGRGCTAGGRRPGLDRRPRRRLGVLGERLIEPRRQRIRIVDHRGQVVRVLFPAWLCGRQLSGAAFVLVRGVGLPATATYVVITMAEPG